MYSFVHHSCILFFFEYMSDEYMSDEYMSDEYMSDEYMSDEYMNRGTSSDLGVAI